MKKIEHPGWAIKYPGNPEGEWLQLGAHGSVCGYGKTPDMSEYLATENEAFNLAETLKIEDNMTAPYVLIEAWEPWCYELQRENNSLEQANNVTPVDIWSIEEMLDDIKNILNKKQKGKV